MNRILNVRTVVHDGNILSVYFTLGPNLSRKVYILNHRGEEAIPDGQVLPTLKSIVETQGWNIPGYAGMTTVNLGKAIVRYP